MEKAYLITENTNLEKLYLDKDKYDRFYFWDAYCEHNFMYFLNNKDFLDNLSKMDKCLTMTTPIISEKNLTNFKKILELFWELKWFEIVVNDYWILNYLTLYFPNIKLIWWNFLSWQNKDPYLKIFKDKQVHKKITIDNSFYKNYLETKWIDLVELYNVFQWIDIENSYNFSLYYPYVVYSINRYCPTKLVYDNKNYLTVVEDCDWCLWKIPSNFNMDLKMKTDSSKNFFRWNKQFYENLEIINNDKIKRIIYNYDLLW